jgi:Tfp pilus assembly protein PilF
MALSLAGELDQADEVLTGVLAEEPDHAQALHTLAQLRYRQGREEEADGLMLRYRELQVGLDAAAGRRNYIDQR